MRAVLVDAGPLLALVDRHDEHHDRADGELFVIEERSLRLVVPWTTLLEAYTLVMRRFGVKRAQTWLAEATAGTSQVSPTREYYERAGELVGRFRDQDITLFDGLLAVLSEDLGLPVWTFDHHFDVMGARVWR